MNLREEILKEHSKKQTQKIVSFIGDDIKLFAQLMNLFFANEYRVTQRSAWVVSECFQNHPELVDVYLKSLIENLNNQVHDAVKRNTLRMLQFITIPKDLQGMAFENCMKLLLNIEEPIAVKAFAMTVLSNICKQEPDLKNELKIVIEEQLPYGSPGFKSRANKVLKEWQKLK